MSTGRSIAFLAEHRLFLLGPDGKPEEVESYFVREVESRAERDRSRSGWKADSMGWNLRARAAGAPEILSQIQGFGGGGRDRPVRFTALAPSAPGKWYYSLCLGNVGGLFEYEEADTSERRIIHRVGLQITHISPRSPGGMLALTVTGAHGTAHLATMDPRGRGIKEVTEGDCVDECPSWHPKENSLVYQSAGLGAGQSGLPMRSPYAIHQLDLDSGVHGTLCEDPGYDFLMPRLAADGTLYCIRRPYEGTPRAPWWRPLVDALLFPFRLVVAIGAFLNVFSLIFARKPLFTAGGPDGPRADARWLLLYGRVLSLKSRAGQPPESPLVPSNWELIRLRPGPDGKPTGDPEVIAKSILSFDLAEDGTLLYTTGSRLTCHPPNGTPVELAKTPYIECVRIQPT